MLVVLSIAKREGSTLPAATINCLFSSLQSDLRTTILLELPKMNENLANDPYLIHDFGLARLDIINIDL